jgi:hypothetical protein
MAQAVTAKSSTPPGSSERVPLNLPAIRLVSFCLNVF